ncbi:MAG: hypothetical protein ACFB51_18285 [Anaerolineae bacterium]
MEEFTIGLALYDFLPGIFIGIALFLIARMVQRTDPSSAPMAYIGAGLVTASGVFKALWKLIIATGGPDIVLLDEQLFILMAPGFTLTMVAVWSALRARRGKHSPGWLWVLPVAAIAIVYAIGLYQTLGAGVERGWFQPVMSLASIANLTLTVLLVIECVRSGKWPVGVLFVINFVMIFPLIAIAQMSEISIAMHWFEQTLTVGQSAAFALAAYLLSRTVTTQLPETPSVAPAAGR